MIDTNSKDEELSLMDDVNFRDEELSIVNNRNDNSIFINEEVLRLLRSISGKLSLLEDMKPKVDKLYEKALDEEGNQYHYQHDYCNNLIHNELIISYGKI